MKHSCERALSLAHRYIDGEMIWFRRRRVEWHLNRCQHCDEGFLFERRLKQIGASKYPLTAYRGETAMDAVPFIRDYAPETNLEAFSAATASAGRGTCWATAAPGRTTRSGRRSAPPTG